MPLYQVAGPALDIPPASPYFLPFEFLKEAA